MSSFKSKPSSSNYDPDETVQKRRKVVQESHCYALPVDIMVKIFTYLDFKDFKNCMGLCTEIRDYIFKTPKIMKKIDVQFFDWREKDKPSRLMPYERFKIFLRTRGKYIVNFRAKFYKYTQLGRSCLIKFVNYLPNIEHFEFFVAITYERKYGLEHSDSDDSDDEPRRTYIRRLPKLKKLKVSHKYLDLFMGKVTTLEHFHIGEAQGDIDKTKDITTFMNCQKNLEELWFMNEDYGLCTYTIDLSPGFNFKLKSLSMDREAENFTEFLDMLADDLEEMYLYMLPHPRLYESLKKFKKLENLRIPIKSNDDFFTSSRFLGWELHSVINFDVVLDAKLSIIVSRFPNLKYIQCTLLEKDSGVFESIETIDVDYFDPKLLDDVTLPNWKTLIVRNPVDEEEWTQLAARIPNVETKLMKGFKSDPENQVKDSDDDDDDDDD